MNLLDLAILAVFALFVLIGLYEGFLKSALSTVAFFLSWLLGLLVAPLFSRYLRTFDKLSSMLLYYTEGAERLASVEQARLKVADLSAAQIDEILSQASLPAPLDQLIEKNLSSEAFAQQGIVTVGEYFNQTMVNFTINVVSFVAIFLLVRCIIGLILRAMDYITVFPVLSRWDGLMGAGVSVLRCLFVLFVVFMFVPLALMLLPTTGTFGATMIGDYIQNSFFGWFFYDCNFLLMLIKGV
jgi:uncharacterized membrane protein required for colicin V production